jgi:tetratricopeptide (TPR) repeat protein
MSADLKEPDRLIKAADAAGQRFKLSDDAADLAAAIGHLTQALSLTPVSDPQWPALADNLAELHLTNSDRLEAGRQAAELEVAITYERSVLAWLEQFGHEDPDGSYAETLGRLGFFFSKRFSLAFRDLADGDLAGAMAVRPYLDEAISLLGQAYSLFLEDPSAEEGSWQALAAEISLLSHCRYTYPWPGADWPNPVDLNSTIELLIKLISAGDYDHDQLSTLVTALADRVDLTGDQADLELAILWAERLLEHPQSDAEDQEFALCLITKTFWAKHRGQPSVTDEDLARQIDYGWRAWHGLADEHEARPEVGLGLAAALFEQMMRSECFDESAVNAALDVLTYALPRLTAPILLHTAHTVLAAIYTVRSQITGSKADLASAEQWVEQSLTGATNDPDDALLNQMLAVCIATLIELGVATDHLETGIDLLKSALARPQSDPTEEARLRISLGTTYARRADRTARLADLDAAVIELTSAYELLEPENPSRLTVAWNLGPILLLRFQRTGDLRDRDAARFFLDILGQRDSPADQRPGPWATDLEVGRAALYGMLSLTDAVGGNMSALDEAIRQLQAAAALLPEDHVKRGRLRSDLGLAYMMRALRLPERQSEEFDRAIAEETAALEILPPSDLIRPLAMMRLAMAVTAEAMIARDPVRLRAVIEHTTEVFTELGRDFVGRSRCLAIISAAWHRLFEITGEQSALTKAAGYIAESCEEMSKTAGHPLLARSLSSLCYLQRRRGLRLRSRQAGLAGLRARGRDVMLQTGTSRGLAIARIAAAEAEQLARWCLDDRRPEAAIEALELGRALILHAATNVTSLPELLTDAGHLALAEEWRSHGRLYAEEPWDLGMSGADQAATLLAGLAPLGVPDDLRARALAALAGQPADSLMSPPALSDIRSALDATGADALVYLLGPGNGQPGRAIAVLPAGLQVISLPSFRPGDEAAIDRYADTLAQATDLARPAAALGELSDWAWTSVIGPLLDQARQWSPARPPPRLVLVPVGKLSQVPWHAARQRRDDASGFSYACASAVFSYATSGRQLIDAARRPARAPAENPVVIGNPAGALDGERADHLPYAGLEAQAIRDQCYPDGRYLGRAAAAGGQPADGPGSPAEVLELLPSADASGASLIHLACHAVVSTSAPGQSHLVLAGGEKLMVETVLRQAQGRSATAPGGLVTMAACGSDLTTAEPDEALTLATAFLAAGAVTVVGTRWTIRDGPAASMMFMFHHFLTEHGRSPRDALREAQLWMLDPNRRAPAQMPASLARLTRRSVLAEPLIWAAATHQGR